MAKVTVCFETVPGADMQLASAQVQEMAAALPEVASASAQPVLTHGLGPQEIMMGLQMAGSVMASATTAVVALTALIAALKKLAAEVPSLHKTSVQVGLKKIPVDQVTDQDIQTLAKG